jgi:hypothetical protein
MREAACVVSKEVEATSEARFMLSAEGRGVPSRSLKKACRMDALAGWEKTGLLSSSSSSSRTLI